MSLFDYGLRHAARRSGARALLRSGRLGLSFAAGSVALMFFGFGAPGVAVAVAIAGIIAHGALAAADFARWEVRQLPPAAPHPDELLAPELRERYERIIAKHQRLRDLLPDSNELKLRCRDLVREAGLAAVRINSLHGYLETDREEILDAELSALETRADQVDRAAADVLTQAAFVKLQQLESRTSVQGVFDRTLARLSLIEASFDAMYAKLVEIDAISAEDALSAVTDVSEHLEVLDADMRLLEQAVLGP